MVVYPTSILHEGTENANDGEEEDMRKTRKTSFIERKN